MALKDDLKQILEPEFGKRRAEQPAGVPLTCPVCGHMEEITYEHDMPDGPRIACPCGFSTGGCRDMAAAERQWCQICSAINAAYPNGLQD